MYHSGVDVHIIEPGYFMTGIVDVDRIAKDLNTRFAAADPEVKEYYGETYKDNSK